MFTIDVYEPLAPPYTTLTPLSHIDLNPQITSLTVATSNPGGYGDLEVGMQAYMNDQGPEFMGLPQPIDLVPYAHVVVRAGQHRAFEGRVMGADRNNAGLYSGFYAQGYGLAAIADQYIISSEISKKRSGVIVQEAIRDAAPLLVFNPATFVDPGVYHSKSEYTALYPQDIINAIIREGGQIFAGITTTAGGLGANAAAGAWDWLVYEDRVIQFTPRLPPAGTPADPVDWWLPFDSRVQWHEDYMPLVGSVQVRYQSLDAAGSAEVITPAAIDPTFERRFKLMRSAMIEGGPMAKAAAETFASTYLANMNDIAVSVQVTLAQQQSVQKPPGGDLLPPWMVRAGDWLQIGGEPPLPVIHTQYDAFSEVLTIECGQPLPRGSHLVRTLSRVANHIVRKTNPVTGGRA